MLQDFKDTRDQYYSLKPEHRHNAGPLESSLEMGKQTGFFLFFLISKQAGMNTTSLIFMKNVENSKG